MIKVNLDIAGFYFNCEVEVPEDATVKDVMNAAVILTAAGPTASQGKLLYDTDAAGDVDRITVIHSSTSAVSRQKSIFAGAAASEYAPRTYPAGIYSFSDDAVLVEVNGVKQFRSVDSNRMFVHAWQYYVYDAHFVDQARRRPYPPTGGGNPAIDRQIVPFGVGGPGKGYSLTHGSTVVWRLVTIMTGPNVSDEALIPTTIVQVPVRIY